MGIKHAYLTKHYIECIITKVDREHLNFAETESPLFSRETHSDVASLYGAE